MLANTPENRLKFLTLYWGQGLIFNTNIKSGESISLDSFMLIYSGDLSGFYADLKMPEEMNSSELKEFGIIGLGADYDETVTEQECINFGKEMLTYRLQGSHEVEFLRSKGYAYSYMGLSVDQQVEYGWVKFKN